MTVTVDVPLNTPGEDTVYFQSGPFVAWPMEPVDDDTWTITLREIDLVNAAYGEGESYRGPSFDRGANTVSYAFTRGWGYLGAEALVDEGDQDTFWAVTREVRFVPGTAHHDTVDRWRWLPPDDALLPTYDPDVKGWQPRAGGAEFQAGVFLADVWDDTMTVLTGPTNRAAKEGARATWVQLAPPWDYREVDPLPVISNQGVEVPAYADEEDLRKHIREIKASGLKVILEPQVCCNTSFEMELGEDWYREWFDQYEAFLLYHARIAADEGVDAMILDWSGGHIGALPGSPGAYPWFEERWRQLMAGARAVYRGPIGHTLLLAQPVGVHGPPWPYGELTTILDLFDYLGVSIWAGLAEGNDDSYAEIAERVESLFDADLLPVYQETGKPMILASVAYGSYDGGAQSKLGVYDVALEAYHPEQATRLVYDPIEQAMVFDAIMQAVAQRPYIVGIYPFLYQYIALPLSPDYSVRGKPAEQVIAAWYELAARQ
jgi:hypothetical protein